MKKPILLCLLASAFCLPTWAQQYSIDWNKVAGGRRDRHRRELCRQRHHWPARRGRAADRRILGADLGGPNTGVAGLEGYPFGQQRDCFLAEHGQLHIAAKFQSGHPRRLDCQWLYHHHRQRDKQHHHHAAHGESVLPIETIVWPARCRGQATTKRFRSSPARFFCACKRKRCFT